MKNKISFVILALVLLFFIMPIVSADLIAEDADVKVILNTYDPVPAEPDSNLRVWVSVENQGNEQTGNAYVKVNPEFPFVLLSGAGQIKETGVIPVGGSKILDYKLFVSKNANEGDYDLEFIVCQDSECKKAIRTKSVSINVKTGGTPNINLGVEETDALGFDKNSRITLNIVNKGELTTKYLTVSLKETDEYLVLSPAEVYVGELESDDFETAVFDVYFKGEGDTSTRKIELPVTVEYSDANNKEYSESTVLELRVYSPEDLIKYGLVNKPTNYGIYVVIILLAVGGFIAYRRIKKRMKRKE